MEPKTKMSNEQVFIDQMTRKKMVEWCDHEVQHPDEKDLFEPPYRDYAISKGWLSKDGTKILAAGWQTAARFLKR